MADKIVLKSDKSADQVDVDQLSPEQAETKPVKEKLADLDIDGKTLPNKQSTLEAATIKPIETKKPETADILKEKPIEQPEKTAINKPENEKKQINDIKDEIKKSPDHNHPKENQELSESEVLNVINKGDYSKIEEAMETPGK